MKFHLGPIPEDPLFEPEASGWKAIREPSPGIAQLFAVPICLAVVLTVGFTWSLVIPASRMLITYEAVATLFFPMFVLMIPFHEYIHSQCHPLRGRSPATILGVWPRQLLFYAHYDDEMSRNRFLLVLAAPFITLTMGPLGVCSLLSVAPPWAIAVSIANGVGASVDLFGILLVAPQVPASAMVRNKGWRTWWRPAA